jgi:hypothetical protein
VRFLTTERNRVVGISAVQFQLDGLWEGRLLAVADYWYQTVHRNDRAATTSTEHLSVMVVQLAVEYPSLVLHSRTFGSLGLGGIPDLDQRLSWVLALALQLDKPS